MLDKLVEPLFLELAGAHKVFLTITLSLDGLSFLGQKFYTRKEILAASVRGPVARVRFPYIHELSPFEIVLLVTLELVVETRKVRCRFCEGTVRVVRCVTIDLAVCIAIRIAVGLAILLKAAETIEVRKVRHRQMTQTVSQ
jgi:hypothetical protein